MHNAMINGDTETMKILLDRGSVKIDKWVGIGNIQTWVEDACWAASSTALEYLLQRGADTLRPDTVRLWKDGRPTTAPGWQPSNALGWCIGGGVRQNNWQTLLDDRSKSNPTCVAYIRNELEKRKKSTPPPLGAIRILRMRSRD
jgi:hypothetical protein